MTARIPTDVCKAACAAAPPLRLRTSCLAQVIAIANDITYSSGSFGPREDAAFRAALEHALAERLPVVYLAANSGARVGLANEVKQCLQACPVRDSITLLATL